MRSTTSLIIPAYNESIRLPPYLESIHAYFGREGSGEHEVIVVDDGSTDGTADIVASRAKDWQELRLIRHTSNRGKGAAVRTGMLEANGHLLLFADADGATPIEEEAKLRCAITEGGADLAVGSRRTCQSQRALLRGLYGRAFSGLVRSILPIDVRDTQCGFKMFRSHIARELFFQCQEAGYLFDLQILAMASRRGYDVAEIEIRWREVTGSKVRLVRDSIRMITGLVRLSEELRAVAAELSKDQAVVDDVGGSGRPISSHRRS